MGRKCTVCQHPDKTEIDRKIVANDGSSLTIARLFGLSDDAVARHRSHLKSAIRNAQVIRSTGFQELTKAIDRLVLKVEKHLSISAKSEVWFKESRELRNWVALRAKLAGKVVMPGSSETAREGDRYCVQFVAPDGQPATIPLNVYRSLPKSAFERAQGDGALAAQSKVPEKAEETKAVIGACAQDVHEVERCGQNLNQR